MNTTTGLQIRTTILGHRDRGRRMEFLSQRHSAYENLGLLHNVCNQPWLLLLGPLGGRCKRSTTPSGNGPGDGVCVCVCV